MAGGGGRGVCLAAERIGPHPVMKPSVTYQITHSPSAYHLKNIRSSQQEVEITEKSANS